MLGVKEKIHTLHFKDLTDTHFFIPLSLSLSRTEQVLSNFLLQLKEAFPLGGEYNILHFFTAELSEKVCNS